jgi:hypothetical protein
MFIRKSLHPRLRNDLTLSSLTIKCENLFIEISNSTSKYIIGGIYRHPNQNVSHFSDVLQNSLNIIAKNKMPCIITGDCNIDLVKADENKATSEFLHNLLLHNCLPVLLLPTRLTLKTATLIDHIYYYEGANSKKDLNIYSGNIFSDISDHLPNFLILGNSKKRASITPKPLIRLYTTKNKNDFQAKLASVNWRDILYSCDDVNVCYNKFLSVITNLFETAFPLTRKSRRACKDKMWITQGLRTSCYHKNKLYRQWQLSKSNIDEIKYKNYKKVYKNVLNKAEINYYDKAFDCKANSIKKLWCNLNSICSAKKKKKNGILLIN